VGRVPVYLDPALPVLVVLLAAVGLPGVTPLSGAVAVLLLVLFVAAHEGGHAWMARRRGLGVTGIHLHLFSVVWVEAAGPADTWRVALAGPAANLVLAGLLLGVRALAGSLPRGPEAWIGDPLAFAGAANLALGTLNLVPVLPADGGRALAALLEQATGRALARRLVAGLGLVLGLTGGVAALLLLGSPLGLGLAGLALYVAWTSVRSMKRAS
jgi:membrane-associated protease RseP (regulator of RpoE activity)